MNNFEAFICWADGSVEVECISSDGEFIELNQTVGTTQEPVMCLQQAHDNLHYCETVDPQKPLLVADWFNAELHSLGSISELLDMAHGEDGTAWLLHRGLCPGQRFRVRINPPTYYHDYWSNEWDCDYGSVEVTWREPIDPQVAATRWSTWILGGYLGLTYDMRQFVKLTRYPAHI